MEVSELAKLRVSWAPSEPVSVLVRKGSAGKPMVAPRVMNVSELARRVNVLPQELYELLPQFGFDIGRRAIKIDDRVAQQILRQWPRIRREWERQKEKAREAEERLRRAKAVAEGTAREVELPPIIAVRDFAATLGLPVAIVLKELLRNGILANLNEPIDYATAAIIAEDLGFRTKAAATSAEAEIEAATTPAPTPATPSAGSAPRPPVIVVMGHVDHGKTALLDRIRSTSVAAGEAGGITQHIGAYQVSFNQEGVAIADSRAAQIDAMRRSGASSERGVDGTTVSEQWSEDRAEGCSAREAGSARSQGGATARDMRGSRKITFIDTPGHEAFTTMRSRGARAADIAVLVVAADDGVQPQTKEALKIIQSAKLSFVVAVNKIDKAEASVDRVMQELGALGVTSEAWGGKVPFVPVSAKTGEGIPQLLEVLLLLADVERDRLLADPHGAAAAVTVESHLDKQEGPVATLLVQHGTLRSGDVLAVRGAFVGKIRLMRDHRGQTLNEAPPSTPVRILGFKVPPEVGDVVEVATDRKGLVDVKKKITTPAQPVVVASPTAAATDATEPAIILPIVLRADVLGSLEAVASEVEKLGDASVRVKVIGRGLGNITEGDVAQAEAAKGRIYGFGVAVQPPIAELARTQGVPITISKIIYELLDAIRLALEALIPEEVIREELGVIQVLALFRKEPKWQIVGGKVLSGKIAFDPKFVKVELVRGDEVVTVGRLLGLQAGKEEVREVVSGQECGMKVGNIEGLQTGDTLRFVREEKRKKKLG